MATSHRLRHVVADGSHDYIWARLPALLPAAAEVDRACHAAKRECARLAYLVDQLHFLTLRHLDREERLLVRLGAIRDSEVLLEELAGRTGEHRDLRALLSRVCEAAGLSAEPGEDACPTSHAFREELRSLDRVLSDQIAMEDEILATHLAPARG